MDARGLVGVQFGQHGERCAGILLPVDFAIRDGEVRIDGRIARIELTR